MSKQNPETDRVILLIKRYVRDKLAKFCKDYRSKDGFKIRMSEFGDIAIIEKLEKMQKRIERREK